MTTEFFVAATKMPKLRPAAFIDRDGVINRDLGHVHRKQDFEIIPGTIAGLAALQAYGFALIVVTNQAGIAKGLYDEKCFLSLTQYMEKLLEREAVWLDGVYYCPHHPQGAVAAYRKECECRKPRPGMLLRAAGELGLDLASSVLVGDKRSDIEAGRSAGVSRCVLVQSGHRVTSDDIASADICLPDLRAAASWLMSST